MRLTRPVWIFLTVLVFVASFAIRTVAIKLTPRGDYYVDLEIYRASADLILHGVNPYDFSDKVAVRSVLRQQAHSPSIRNDQAVWDYYASSNLPMNLFFFAGISAIDNTPRFHRYSYAFFDSILSVLVLWFVIRHWGRRQGALSVTLESRGLSSHAALLAERLLIGLALVGFSPVFLKSGVAFPEDKGVEILLILAGIACSLSRDDQVWYWGGALFLGLSIAFKGLGIFLTPLFARRLLASPTRKWQRFFGFALVVALLAAVWIPPFWPGVANMVKTRLLLASTLQPQHASIWVLPSIYLPSIWKPLRVGAMCVVVCVSFLGYWRRKISLDLLCTTLLLGFVVVWLINGGMDRENIGIVPALLVLGSSSVNAAMLCMVPYFFISGVGGLVTRGVFSPTLEGFGMLLSIGTYLGVLCWFSFASGHQEQVEALQESSSV